MIDLKDGTRSEYSIPGLGANGGAHQPDRGRVPRVSRLMALAIKFECQLREGDLRNHRAIAEAGHVSRARLSQIMRMADLAPSIQEELLFLPRIVVGPDRITEKQLRHVASLTDWDEQRRRFEELKQTGVSL
jgi:hypothetical protein